MDSPADGTHLTVLPGGAWVRTLPRAAAFWTLAGLFLMVFFASAAASPLYRVY